MADPFRPPDPRPRLVVSQCLELDACRYNGLSIRAPIVKRLADHVDLQPVCPELEIGLGVPRDPIRLVRLEGSVGLVQPSTGRDLTRQMDRFSERYLDGLPPVEGFLLKSKSPSCGLGDAKVYGQVDGGSSLGKESGLFAATVQERHPDLAVEHEGRLTNFAIRDHFLTRLWAFARLRALLAEPSMGRLVEFHARHKLVLMASGQAPLRRLGRLVANQEALPLETLVPRYAEGFRGALRRQASRGSHVNVLEHARGYFKKHLGASEKRHFSTVLDDFLARRVDRSAPLVLLQSWIVRFDEAYMSRQYYFAPYPAELMELSDSGRGRPDG